MFLSSLAIAQQQKKIEIINAEDIIFNSNLHPTYRRLIGDVRFKHQDAIMHCDSAYHYQHNKMDAFGKIRINQGDSIHLSGKRLIYNGNTSIAIISGDVKLVDNHIELSTEKIIYDLEKNIAFYPKKGKIIDVENNLTSDKGSYYSKLYLFYFKGNVEIINKDYIVKTDTMQYNSKNKVSYFIGPSTITSDANIIYCEKGWYNSKTNIAQFQKNANITHKDYFMEGDSIYYDRNKGYGKAIKNINLIDTINNLIITGDLGEYFEKEKNVIVTQKAILNLLFEEDTFFVHADTFMSININGNRKILSYHNVKGYKTDMQIKCDSLSYDPQNSTIELFVSPVIWTDSFQIVADSINMFLANGTINKMFLREKPIIISKEDSLYYNQITGKKMTVFFKENQLQKINVIGNSQTIFLAQNNKKENIGINTSESSDITIFFKNHELDGLLFLTKPEAIMHPMDKIEEKDRFLKGFIWRVDEKPKSKEDIFD